MRIVWRVVIHRLVIRDDLKSIDKSTARFILKSIYRKLSKDPESYGSPLLGQFKGYWKLRVGDFRVVYKINKDEVLVSVIKVGIRRDDKVYKELINRLNKI